MNHCVGLFGTCGDSKWREPFIEKFNKENITFFNPQVDDWTPDCADLEADHLANDSVICMPITGETYGIGSLAEVGFTVAQIIECPKRELVIMVEPECAFSDVHTDLSNRTRALVNAHLSHIDKPNIHVVESLEIMRGIASALYLANPR